MTTRQWKSLLSAWSAQLLATDLTSHLDPAERNLKYLGFPPASAASIKSLEARLGAPLPPSYRTFLQTTDGFRVISPFTHRLRPVADIDWFKIENQGWIETYNEPTMYDDPDYVEPADEEYFDYTLGNELNFRRPHLAAMLQISDADDGVMLLNPLAVTPDGEWEAWFFANWIPGANRYASFAHMMVETYRTLRQLQKLPDTPKLPSLKLPSPKTLRHSVVAPPELPKPKRQPRKRRKNQSQLEYAAQFLADISGEEIAPAPPDLVKLLNDLNNPDDKARAKTVRILQGKLKIRGMSTRHPDLVPLAASLAGSHLDPLVRSTCIDILTNITPDGPIPDWLLVALNDSHPWVIYAALGTTNHFTGPDLIAPLAKILADRHDVQLAHRAVSALSDIPDLRVIPVLAAQLETECRFDPSYPPEIRRHLANQFYACVTRGLARFGTRSLPHILPLLHHPDPARRYAAVLALRMLSDHDPRPNVAKLKTDPDPDVRQQATLADTHWGGSPGFLPHTL